VEITSERAYSSDEPFMKIIDGRILPALLPET
jgi:hypothetical protein